MFSLAHAQVETDIILEQRRDLPSAGFEDPVGTARSLDAADHSEERRDLQSKRVGRPVDVEEAVLHIILQVIPAHAVQPALAVDSGVTVLFFSRSRSRGTLEVIQDAL